MDPVDAGEPTLRGMFVGTTSHLHGAGRAYGLLERPLRERGILFELVTMRRLRDMVGTLGRWVFGGGARRPDFVLFNALGSMMSPAAEALARLASAAHVPIVVYWREGAMSFAKYHALGEASVRRAERIARLPGVVPFANSTACAAFIAGHFPGSRPVVVGNAADPGIDPAQDSVPPTEPPTVVNVGSIQPRKGTDLFVETALLACRRHPTVEFLWIGPGRPNSEWTEAIARAGFTSRIRFVGAMDRPALLVRNASAFFCSSREETFSQATAEAMALGVHVVTFDSGGPPEVLGGTGTVVADFDCERAATELERLVRFPPERRRNEAAARRYAEEFTPERHADRLAAHLRRVVATKAGN
ncbi:MAG: glycosyltransferase family 4 protein [Polyangiaceae bacterium]